MSWDAHLDVLRQAEIRAQAARGKDRFVVMEVRPDGVPIDRQAFAALVDALDLRDELQRSRLGRVFFGVIDRDDEERGWLDHEDACEVVA